MLRRHKTLGNRGDTIVEVMVVLAVLGLALGISFATANRSLLSTRAAQENSQATALLQSQIERLRSLSKLAPSDPNNIFNGTSGLFCISSSNTKVIITSVTGADPLTATYPSSGACTTSFFNLSISYDAASGDTFKAEAVWDDVQAQGKDTVTLLYRLHP